MTLPSLLKEKNQGSTSCRVPLFNYNTSTLGSLASFGSTRVSYSDGSSYPSFLHPRFFQRKHDEQKEGFDEDDSLFENLPERANRIDYQRRLRIPELDDEDDDDDDAEGGDDFSFLPNRHQLLNYENQSDMQSSSMATRKFEDTAASSFASFSRRLLGDCGAFMIGGVTPQEFWSKCENIFRQWKDERQERRNRQDRFNDHRRSRSADSYSSRRRRRFREEEEEQLRHEERASKKNRRSDRYGKNLRYEWGTKPSLSLDSSVGDSPMDELSMPSAVTYCSSTSDSSGTDESAASLRRMQRMQERRRKRRQSGANTADSHGRHAKRDEQEEQSLLSVPADIADVAAKQLSTTYSSSCSGRDDVPTTAAYKAARLQAEAAAAMVPAGLPSGFAATASSAMCGGSGNMVNDQQYISTAACGLPFNDIPSTRRRVMV